MTRLVTIKEVSLGKNRSDELNDRLRDHRSNTKRQPYLKRVMENGRVLGPSKQQKADMLRKHVELGTDKLLKDYFEKYEEEMLEVCEEIIKHPMFDGRVVRPAIAFQTGIISLDYALGGGIPAGVVEVYGEESVGKTTLLASFIQGAQSQGRETALCMSEFFDKPRFAQMGICLDELLFLKGNGEVVLGLAADFVTRRNFRILFIDSMTGFRPEDDEFDAWVHMVLAWLRHTSLYVGTDSAIVMVNQVRARKSKEPDKMFAGGTSSAARRVAGLFDTRLELSRESVTETTYDLVINIVSNTLARPSRYITLPVIKDKGIDVWRDLVRMAAGVGTLTKEGSWYYAGRNKLGQGEESVARILESNSDITQCVLEQTMSRLGR